MNNNPIGRRNNVVVANPQGTGNTAGNVNVNTNNLTTTTTTSSHQVNDHVDTSSHNAAHDMRYRVGVNAVTAGPTTTAIPQLLADWKVAVYEAAAVALADQEVIAPALNKALDKAEGHKGEPLTRREERGIEHKVRDSLDKEYGAAFKAHHKDLTKSPSTKAQTERDVVLAERPRVAHLKDPFTPVIQNAPGSRANEIVLWESKNFLVVVDTFADSPKALVVPKTKVNLPVDAPQGLLDEAALVAAHVSDAFMRATGCKAAGIWINAPQNLTVAQLHVHVLPDVGPYTADGAMAKQFIEDPTARPQLEAWFGQIKGELASKLGPST
jgi:diadenosine tetraphosphate (Ap4A) HIT family hydrolase